MMENTDRTDKKDCIVPVRYPAPVIVTRPQPEADRTAQALRHAGFIPFVESLGRVSYTNPGSLLNLEDDLFGRDVPDDANTTAGVILTSARAVPVLNRLKAPQDTSFYIVGRRTAELLRQSGYTKIIQISDTAHTLQSWLIENRHSITSPLVYFRGRDVTLSLVENLRDSGIKAEQHIVYTVHQVEHFTLELKNLLHKQGERKGCHDSARRPPVITLASVRAAKIYRSLCRKEHIDFPGSARYLCFSRNIANALSEGLADTEKARLESASAFCERAGIKSLVAKLTRMYDKRIW